MSYNNFGERDSEFGSQRGEFGSGRENERRGEYGQGSSNYGSEDRDNEYGSSNYGSNNQSYKKDAGYKGNADGDEPSRYGSSNTYGSENKHSGYGSSNNNSYGSDNKQNNSSGDGGFVGKLTGFMGGSQNKNDNDNQQQSSNNESKGGFMNAFNNMAGGGAKGEKNEDLLDKGIDFVQEKFLGQGPQNNESAVEQAKDKMIAQTIRDGYKSSTGNEFPIKSKGDNNSGNDKKFGLF